MKVKELIKTLAEADPESEIVTSTWNGKVMTYAVIDHVLLAKYWQIENDFFGTPGEMDERLFEIESENIVYIGSDFNCNDKVREDRHTVFEISRILKESMYSEEKESRITKLINKFLAEE